MCPIGDGDAVKLSEGILDRAVVGAGDATEKGWEKVVEGWARQRTGH